MNYITIFGELLDINLPIESPTDVPNFQANEITVDQRPNENRLCIHRHIFLMPGNGANGLR